MGWEAVFYLHGGLAIIWCVLWAIFVTDSPETHKFISKEEKDFISQNSSAGGQKVLVKIVILLKFFLKKILLEKACPSSVE